MRQFIYPLVCFWFLAMGEIHAQVKENPFSPYQLIAHRGGVVDSNRPENSLDALEEAIRQGYDRVEIDVRKTKDGKLITHHDPNFRRSLGVNREVKDMDWNEISVLKGESGYRVYLLEEILSKCEGKIAIMIDLKIPGKEEEAFQELVHLSQKFGLLENAIMIGTSASMEFFKGKIKISSTRKQLETYMQSTAFDPSHYFLFDKEISGPDRIWAESNKIMVVGAVNSFHFDQKNLLKEAKNAISTLKENGVRIFQIDAIFSTYFSQP